MCHQFDIKQNMCASVTTFKGWSSSNILSGWSGSAHSCVHPQIPEMSQKLYKHSGWDFSYESTLTD